MNTSLELEVVLEVERRLASLLIGSPGLSDLPIAPVRGVSDLSATWACAPALRRDPPLPTQQSARRQGSENPRGGPRAAA